MIKVRKKITGSQYRLFNKISALDSGKVLVYGQGNQFWVLNYLYNLKTNTMEFNNVDNPSADPKYANNSELIRLFNNYKKGIIRMLYLIPISENRNIGIFVDRSEKQTGNELDSIPIGSLLLTLLDDNLVKVNTSSNSQWNKLHVIENPFNKTKPGQNKNDVDNFSKSYYSTLDGRVYFTAFNSFFCFLSTKKWERH